MKAKFILLIVLLAMLIILLFQNTEEIVFRVLFWKITMSQIILVPLAVIVGFFFGYFIGRTDRKSPKS